MKISKLLPLKLLKYILEYRMSLILMMTYFFKYQSKNIRLFYVSIYYLAKLQSCIFYRINSERFLALPKMYGFKCLLLLENI